ncbi:hypothetical protein [Halobiforma nitratireducens]|uniref:hypothetical protein n=1 Tax=Halobiforma nitratireducens TaxID=130048 RepID=UPI0018722761|nr:hypothetical protein [Halobiforma nitratireducens]
MSNRTGFRRLVEAYTPDGTLGRLGLSAVSGSAGVYALLVAFGFLVSPWIGSLLLVPIAAVAGVCPTVVTVLTEAAFERNSRPSSRNRRGSARDAGIERSRDDDADLPIGPERTG